MSIKNDKMPDPVERNTEATRLNTRLAIIGIIIASITSLPPVLIFITRSLLPEFDQRYQEFESGISHDALEVIKWILCCTQILILVSSFVWISNLIGKANSRRDIKESIYILYLEKDRRIIILLKLFLRSATILLAFAKIQEGDIFTWSTISLIYILAMVSIGCAQIAAKQHLQIKTSKLLNGVECVFDLVFIFYTGTILDGPSFNLIHLALIIPLLSVWTVPPYPKYVFLSIIFLIICQGIEFHDRPNDSPVIISLSYIVPRFLFWVAIGFIVTLLLSFVHRIDKYLLERKLLLSGLESLDDHLLRFVFAKDENRRFTYLNTSLLNAISGELQETKFKKSNGTIVTEDNPLELEDVVGRTDFELGIDCQEYFLSDAEVLGYCEVPDHELKSKWRPEGDPRFPPPPTPGGQAFEGYEPIFDATNENESRVGLWTIKKPLFGPSGQICGLIGEATFGLPLQVRTLARTFSHLPEFALMKTLKTGSHTARIVWGNHRYLDSIKGRLEVLASSRGIDFKPNDDPLLLLSKIGMSNQGFPTDDEVYCDDGTTSEVERNLIKQYSRDDWEVFSRGVCAGTNPGVEGEFLNKLLSEWASEQHSVQNFPENGWVELHKFAERGWRYTLVRKWPWWNSEGKIKGVIVVFQDIHEATLRKNIVWRWLKRHLRQAAVSARHFSATGKNNASDLQSVVKVFELHLKMLDWMKHYIENPFQKHPDHKLEPLSSHELTQLVNIMTADTSIPRIDFEIGESAINNKYMYPVEVVAILLCLLINSGEAYRRLRRRRVSLPTGEYFTSASISISEADKLPALSIKVTNPNCEETTYRAEDILAGFIRKDLSRNIEFQNSPGGGFLLVRALNRILWTGYNLGDKAETIKLRTENDEFEIEALIPLGVLPIGV